MFNIFFSNIYFIYAPNFTLICTTQTTPHKYFTKYCSNSYFSESNNLENTSDIRKNYELIRQSLWDKNSQ